MRATSAQQDLHQDDNPSFIFLLGPNDDTDFDCLHRGHIFSIL
jgi:hypothetical protein